MYTQVENFHAEPISRLELKFQAHSESPLFVDWIEFLIESMKRTCAIRLGTYSEAG